LPVSENLSSSYRQCKDTMVSTDRQFIDAEHHLPSLLARSHQLQFRADKLISQGQIKIKDSKISVPETEKLQAPRVEQKREYFRILGEKETIWKYYEKGKPIDGGATGKLFNAKKKKVIGQDDFLDSRDYVVKVRRKKIGGDTSVWRTVMKELMSSQVCPHILEIREIFEDNKFFYIVMPKCSGGELFELLINEVDVPLGECKRIMREILVALNDLHSRGLVHGDVKPENLMFDKSEKTVKLIDFDTCEPWAPNSRKQTRIQGSPMYIAPEVLEGKASPQSDLFSVGVILFLLMMGEMPWSRDLPDLSSDTNVGGASATVVYKALRKEIRELDWKEAPWSDHASVADLCKKLLAFDPVDRIQSATEALNHPWFQEPDLDWC